MGNLEASVLALVELLLGYHPLFIEVLTLTHESGRGTVSDGQFDWGGHLPKCNGGVQRFSQNGWKPFVECKGIRELN